MMRPLPVVTFFLVVVCLSACVEASKAGGLSFGLLNGGSPYFGPVQDGWEAKCEKLGVTCHYRVAGTGPCEETRSAAVREFLDLGVDGIALKPCSDEITKPIIEEADAVGVPIVVFDADVPNTTRAAYVGTINKELGRTMARLLRQLRPEGGTFAIVAPKSGRLEGFLEEITRYNDRDDKGRWYPIEGHEPEMINGTSSVYIGQMQNYSLQNPTAIITMRQSPMRLPGWNAFVDSNRHRNITFIGADGDEDQLKKLNTGYVDGLVGQLPYEIGAVCLEVLHELLTTGRLEKEIYPTGLVAYNIIPIDLPSANVDQNLLGNLKYVGFVCFGLVALSVIGCVAWTLYHRKCVIVKATQPFFLLMVTGGVFVMSSSLVPLSFDDGGDPDSMSSPRSVGICMSTPWLAFTGFTVTFSALFSKTWRVNRLFHSKVRFARVYVAEGDVLAPFAVLLTCNIAVLICWSIFDPLTYVREEHAGTDYWNRVISTYGACRSDNVAAYLVPLALMNASVVAIACWQAWQARNIDSEFSESKYIALTVASLFQGFLTGIPVVVVVKNMPKAFYVVLSFTIFLLCMAVLLLIFLPKISLQRAYAGMSDSDQLRMIGRVIKRSSGEFNRSAMDFPKSDSPYSGEASGLRDGEIRSVMISSGQSSKAFSAKNQSTEFTTKDPSTCGNGRHLADAQIEENESPPEMSRESDEKS